MGKLVDATGQHLANFRHALVAIMALGMALTSPNPKSKL
jgi:hypothetical protein